MVRTLIGKSCTTRHDRLNEGAFLDSFTDVDRDEIAGREAVCDLHLASVVVAKLDLRKVDVVVLNNGRIGRSTAKDQSVIRH